MLSSNALGQQLAFPGAEGYGRLATGGRGGAVIEVTNLNDSGPGSLRNAINTTGKRTIVFRVSGTIALNSSLRISIGNVTIAGQTAPGDGICIKNYNMDIDADNVIIRYMRFRLGDEKKVESDAFGGRGHRNIIIDHCSASWSVDECVSFYDNWNATIQWCLISESLRNSVHSKGPHGYGGIWGGYNCSFHHNLMAHHSSRTPRFNGTSPAPAENVDHRNNVIYNWGFNSSYGGEGGKINMVANYYKYGPATSNKDRIVEPSDANGEFYVADNFVFGYPEITADNWNGGVQGSYWDDVRVDTPHPYAPVLTHTAENAYELVLADAGAVLPNRDSLDTRIVWEVRNQTALYGGAYTGAGTGIIDSQTDVGGWPTLHSTEPLADSDHDGMPDDWETANGLSTSDPNDGNGDLDGDGYTNLEEYLNSLCERADYILAPANLVAATVSPNQVDLTWQEITWYETGFSIERSNNDSTGFIVLATVAPDDTLFSDIGLSPATRYYYRVRALNGGNLSIPSNVASAKTLNADGSPVEVSNPFPPDNAIDVAAKTVLKWTAGAGAISHNIYLGTTNPPDFIGKQIAASFDPRGLDDSTRYYWRIDEVNALGTTAGPVWSFVTEPFHQELIAYWNFDRGSGTVIPDSSDHGITGFLRNMQNSNWIEGYSGYAVDYNGQSTYFLVFYRDALNFNIRGFTISFWIRLSDENKRMPIVSQRPYVNGAWGRGFEIYQTADKNIQFLLADETTESSVNASLADAESGRWLFLITVRDRAAHQLHFYVNGKWKSTVEDNTYDLSNKSDLYIATNAAQDAYFKGALDEIRIHNYALDSTAVAQLYNGYFVDVTSQSPPKNYKIDVKNYPNPFNPQTKIVYTMPVQSSVNLKIINALGQEVTTLVDAVQSAGEHSIIFDASNLNSGVYFYQLTVGARTITKKMLLMK